jgi:hypothetical protein
VKKGAIRFAIAGFLNQTITNWSDPAYSEMRKTQKEAEKTADAQAILLPPVKIKDQKIAEPKPDVTTQEPEIAEEKSETAPRTPDDADYLAEKPEEELPLSVAQTQEPQRMEIKIDNIRPPESIPEILIEYTASEAEKFFIRPAIESVQDISDAGSEDVLIEIPRQFDVYSQNIPTPAPDEKRIDYPVEFFPSYMQEDDSVIWEERETQEESEPLGADGFRAPYSPFRDDPPDDALRAALCFDRLLTDNKEVYPFRLPNTRWVRVECPEVIRGNHYLVGLVLNNGRASYFAWGVPGVNARHAPIGSISTTSQAARTPGPGRRRCGASRRAAATRCRATSW